MKLIESISFVVTPVVERKLTTGQASERRFVWDLKQMDGRERPAKKNGTK